MHFGSLRLEQFQPFLIIFLVAKILFILRNLLFALQVVEFKFRTIVLREVFF